MLPPFPTNPDGTPIDYSMMSMNNAMMASLYPPGVLPPPGAIPFYIPPGYPAPPGATKIDGATLPRPPSFDMFYNMEHSARLMHANSMEGGGIPFRQSFPWIGSADGIAAFGSSVSLPFATQDWPSMNNLMNAGESMENIAQYLHQYQNGNTENSAGTTTTDNDKRSSKENEKVIDREKSRSTNNDDIGLSLDEPMPGSANKVTYGFSNWKTNVGKNVEISSAEKSNEKISKASSSESYSIPTDSMAVMAPMYSRVSSESKSSSTPFTKV